MESSSSDAGATGGGSSGGDGGSSSSGGDDDPASSSSSTGVTGCPEAPLLDAVFDPEEALALDLYPAPGDGPVPLVVFVHGGGWVEGDKSSIGTADALDFFADEGIAVASVNYRLVPAAPWSAQPTDVAAAVAWLVEHADELCLDAERIALFGHSAGAHLVALVATDGDYLGAHGLDPADLRGVIPMDVNAYDIPWAIEHGAEHGVPTAAQNLTAVFTADAAQQVDASPITHVQSPGAPFLIIWAPEFHELEQTLSQVASERFAAALQDAGVEASTYGALDDNHASLVGQFGQPGDQPTERIRAFLRSRL